MKIRSKRIPLKSKRRRIGGRRKGVPSKPGEAYTFLIKCNIHGCPKFRWVLPSDKHHVTRCITCQQDFVKESRRLRQAARRAKLKTSMSESLSKNLVSA